MGGIRIGRVAGIDIQVHWSWFFVLVLLTWSLSEGLFREEHPDWRRVSAWLAGTATSLLLFGSILLHELSHSIVARRLGLGVRSITLFIFGGVSSLAEEPAEPADEFWIAIVGPATSFLLAGLFALAGFALWGTGADTAAFYLAAINLTLGVFNLLPGFPLDGGRILRAGVWNRSGSLLEATRVASWSGSALGFVLMAAGVVLALAGGLLSGIWFVVIGWFLRSQADASYAHALTRNVLEATGVGTVLQPDYHPVHPSASLSSLLSAYFLHYYERYYPVTTDGSLLGLVTLTDLRKFPPDQWKSRTVAEAMTPADHLISVEDTDDLGHAAELMAQSNVHQLPVLDDGRLLGFVTRSDVIRVLEIGGEVGSRGSAKPFHSRSSRHVTKGDPSEYATRPR